MVSRNRKHKPGLAVGMFAQSTVKELEREIESLKLAIVGAAHKPSQRREMFAEKTRLERKLAAVRQLTR